MSSDDDELLPGHPDFERALALGQFEFAKARFVRSLTTGSVEQLIDIASRERDKLTVEIKNLQSVTRTRYETAMRAARAYAAILPHRVGKTWLQPPAPLEKVGEFHGSERIYKHAAKAAKDFAEAQAVLAKKHNQLAALERQLRERLDRQGAALERELSIPGGLDIALKRDPLLNRAYLQMKSLVTDDELGEIVSDGGASERTSTKPSATPEGGTGNGAPSQFPDEPL